MADRHRLFWVPQPGRQLLPGGVRRKGDPAQCEDDRDQALPGAKPGHGGILPADKNTPEIAEIRGVPAATQDPRLYRGLVVTDKQQRVVQFQRKTVHAAAGIIASAGLRHTRELTRTHIYRRDSQEAVRRYDQIFPYLEHGCLVSDDPPDSWRLYLDEATPDSFLPKHCLTEIENQCCEVEPCADHPNQPLESTP